MVFLREEELQTPFSEPLQQELLQQDKAGTAPDDGAATAETPLCVHDAMQQVLYRGQLPSCRLQVRKGPLLPRFPWHRGGLWDVPVQKGDLLRL